MHQRSANEAEYPMEVDNAPENPVMDRVQIALREQLIKTHERVKGELHEKENVLREAKKRREDVGVELYGMQKQLAQLQTNLESMNERHATVVQERTKAEDGVVRLKRTHAEKKAKVDKIRKNVTRSKAELDVLLETIRQAKKYNEEVKSEVAVTRRAAYKAEENVKELEKDKKTQDVYIDGLHDQVKRLEASVGLSEAQLRAQKEQTAEANAMIRETSAELELLAFEKKQLVQQWKSSILALNRRDQALAAAAKALKDSQSRLKDTRGQLLGLKHEIDQAKVEKEGLVMSNTRLESEAKYLQHEIDKVEAEHDSAIEHFELLQKMVANTNEEEAKMASAIRKLESELSTINHKIELVTRERQGLEQQIGTNKHEQTTMSKATMNLVQKEKALLVKIHDKEIEAATMQNELARLRVDTLNTKAHSSQLKDKLDSETKALNDKDSEIESYETDIRRRNDEIEKKMNRVDLLNRKYDKMLDGVDEQEPLGPLEATIKALGKDVEMEEQSSQQLQREWLVDQTELVQTISETDAVQENNTEFSARLNIMKQKRLRLNQDIHANETEVKAIETSMKGMHSDMSRLNELIGKNTQLQTELMNENDIKEREFLHELKELEQDSIQMEGRIADVRTAKKRLLDEIVEVERQVLLWEKKIKLEKETQAALHTSEDANEVKGMEKEIHRMKHRLDNLKREQEVMIREMERAIYKREDIAVKYKNTKGKGGGPKHLTKAELKKKGIMLRNQLEQATSEIASVKDKVEETRMRLKEVRTSLADAEAEFRAGAAQE